MRKWSVGGVVDVGKEYGKKCGDVTVEKWRSRSVGKERGKTVRPNVCWGSQYVRLVVASRQNDQLELRTGGGGGRLLIIAVLTGANRTPQATAQPVAAPVLGFG